MVHPTVNGNTPHTFNINPNSITLPGFPYAQTISPLNKIIHVHA
jgi:hypothetical protein